MTNESERAFLDHLIKVVDIEINNSGQPPARARFALALSLLEQHKGEIDGAAAPSFRNYSADFDDDKPWEG